MNLVFNNGFELECLEVSNGSIFYDGVNREVVDVYVSKHIISLDDLDQLLSNEKATNYLQCFFNDYDSEEPSVFENYTIKKELSVISVNYDVDENGNAIKEERIFFSLCKLTQAEIELLQTKAMLANAVENGVISQEQANSILGI